MAVFAVKDKSSIAPLFAGWQQTMIWSCLQDCMGVAYADDLRKPTSAQIVTGPFGYFAGEVDNGLLGNHLGYAFDMVPQNKLWEDAIELVYGDRVNRRMRYATVKDKNVFDVQGLREIVAGLPAPYTLEAIDRGLYAQVKASGWAADLCENFGSAESFLQNGLGFVVVKDGEIVAGASSFTYYREGIEIEIDTREDQRRRGLALACGARLILECLDRNLYPSWDAHNEGSLALAQKLGYRPAGAYPTYEFV